MPFPQDGGDEREPLVRDFSAGTGEASHEEVLQQAEAQVLRARIIFLSISFFSALVSAVMGIAAWKVTNSLTVEVDDVSSWADAASLMINIGFEHTKAKLTTRRGVLIADFAGGFVSLAMLLGVAMFGVANALQRREGDHKASNNLQQPFFMLLYNIASLVLDFIAIFAYLALRSRMEPEEVVPDDKLNVVSGLMHMMVDLARGLSVTGTTIYMLYIANRTDETPWQKLSEKIHGDVFGSFLVCTCVLICVFMLMTGSAKTLQSLMLEDETEEGKAASDHEQGQPGRRLSKLGRPSRDYGTVPGPS